MKDSHDRIHIFEVKSLNVSGSMSIDSDEYKEKVKVLKELYTAVSKVTPHSYYLPIKRANEWTVWVMKDGKVEEMSYDDFEKQLKS